MIADAFNQRLSGELVSERTLATTSGAFDITAGAWAGDVLRKLGLPADLPAPVIDPGTDLGAILPGVLDDAGARRPRVVAPATHDTASAVVATPLDGADHAFLSSGTWSLIGVELPRPDTGPRAARVGVVNEGGFGAQRLLRNLTGLWLVQECRRQWQREGRSFSFDDLTGLASRATPYRSVIDPADICFVEPGDMPARIRDYCARTGQPVPRDEGETVRCALEGLALAYARALAHLTDLTGRSIAALNIVGGGSRNALLNQLSADATGAVVHAGPVEATALGNALVQLYGLGELGGLSDMREAVRHVADRRGFHPRPSAALDRAADLFTRLRDRARSN
jgi:rhamnulokinase